MKELFYNLGGYNQEIFSWFNKFATNPQVSLGAEIVSRFFDIEMFALYYCLAGISILIHLKFIREEERYHLYSRDYDFMVRLGMSYAIFGFVYAFLKFTINMPRPFCSLSPDSFTTILDTSQERCLSSFPSSHTGLSFLIILSLWGRLNTIGKIVGCCLVAIVASSRMILAMHYPADILYSFFVAYWVYRISYHLYNFLQNNLVAWVKSKIWILLYQ